MTLNPLAKRTAGRQTHARSRIDPPGCDKQYGESEPATEEETVQAVCFVLAQIHPNGIQHLRECLGHREGSWSRRKKAPGLLQIWREAD